MKVVSSVGCSLKLSLHSSNCKNDCLDFFSLPFSPSHFIFFLPLKAKAEVESISLLPSIAMEDVSPVTESEANLEHQRRYGYFYAS